MPRIFVAVTLVLAAWLGLDSPAAHAASSKWTFRVTNSTGRKIRITPYCTDTGTAVKQSRKKFPGSVGRTKTIKVNCGMPSIRVQAKIVTNWKKAQIIYNEFGGPFDKNAVSANGPDKTTGTVSVMHLMDTDENKKVCLYVYELGKVRVIPRKCP